MELAIKGVSKLYRGKVWGLKGFSLTLEHGILGMPCLLWCCWCFS